MDQLAELAKILGVLLGFGIAIWNVHLHKSGVRKDALDKLEKQIATLEEDLKEHVEAGQESRTRLKERMIKLESSIDQLPDKEAVHQLTVGQAEMRGDIRVQGETLKAVSASTMRVEEFLLKSGGAKA